ncbi:MAG: DUF4349 domain-containing protein [Clostridiales bacterium]|nr:DUF4349 domain-containing protein [Clostridiales bacterium]
MKKTLVIVLVIIMVASIFAGCASMDKSEEASYDISDDTRGQSTNLEYMMDSDSAPAPEAMKNTSTYAGSDDGGIYEEGRKAIKTANAQMEVDNYQTAYETIKSMLGDNGYIEESNIWKTPTYVNGEKYLLTNGSLRIRIKADVFLSFTEGLSSIGTVLQSSTNEDDISDMYYDTEARLELKRNEKERLEEYAESIEDPEVFFQVQSRITEVVYDIESLQGTLKKWDSKVDYSTIYISINEKHPEEESALPKPKGFFEKIWENLKDGVSFLGDVVIFLAGALPVLLLMAAIVIVIIVIIKKVSKKSKPRPPVNKDSE